MPQGSILSSILYNIFASDQPTTPNILVADYADDKALISINNDPIRATINILTLTLWKNCLQNGGSKLI